MFFSKWPFMQPFKFVELQNFLIYFKYAHLLILTIIFIRLYFLYYNFINIVKARLFITIFSANALFNVIFR